MKIIIKISELSLYLTHDNEKSEETEKMNG